MTQPNGVPPREAMQPQPVPAQWILTPIQSPQGAMVVVQVSTHQGVSVFFLSASDAKSIAAQLDRVSSQAATGLILPPGN